MKKPAKKNRGGVTPAKLALIGVLAVVQVVVIVRAVLQSSKPVAAAVEESESHSVGESKSRRGGRKTSQTGRATESIEPRPSTLDPPTSPDPPTAWPENSLQDALTIDPFQKPTWIAVTAPARTQDETAQDGTMEQLKQQGASIVIVSGDKKAATIGDEQYHVGDVVAGYQVTDITTRGVEFTKLQP